MPAHMINSFQPIRPRTTEDGTIGLYYRTTWSAQWGDRYVVTDIRNMEIQITLYRAVRRGEIPNYVSIEELHSFLFGDSPYLSKNAMGATVIRTVMNNPRKLKGRTKTNDKARVLYAFNHILELQYGLEWMICTWLRNFLNSTSAPGEAITGPEMMAEELDMLANSSEREFREIYVDPLKEFSMKEPDWKKLTEKFREEMPVVENHRPRPPKPMILKSRK